MSEIQQRTENDVHAIAEQLGLIAYLPQANELFLDLDNGPEPNHEVMKRLEVDPDPEEPEAQESMLALRVLSTQLTISNGGNHHLYIKLNKEIKNPLAAIALQAALGSDPLKEYLSTLRVMIGSTAAVALFETPAMGAKVMAWRRRVKSL